MNDEQHLIESEHDYRGWNNGSERYYNYNLECYVDEYGNRHENQEDSYW